MIIRAKAGLNLSINRFLIFFAIFGWLFFLYIDPIFILEYGLIAPSHGFAIMLLTLVSFDVVKNPRIEKRIFSIFVLTVAFLLIGFLSSLAVDPAIKQTIILTYYLAITTSIFVFVSRESQVVTKLLIAVIAGAIVAMLYAHYHQIEFARGRLTLVADYNPTWFAAQLMGAIIASIFLLERSTALITKSLLVLVIGGCLYTTLVSQSQTALFSFLLAIGITGLLFFANLWKYVLVLTAIVVVAFSTYDSAYLLEQVPRIQRTLDFELHGVDAATSGRFHRWQQSFSMQQLTLFGAGWGNASLKLGLGSPHNTYALLLLEAGIVGLLSFLIALLAVGKVMIRDVFLSFCFIFFLIFMIGNDMLHYKYAWGIAIIIGMIYFYKSAMLGTLSKRNKSVFKSGSMQKAVAQ